MFHAFSASYQPFFFFAQLHRFMSNIAAPKIPDGEKVDFDVSLLPRNAFFKKKKKGRHTLLVSAGHPQETSRQRSDRAAVAHRGSLHPEEEGGRGARRPRQQNCESRPSNLQQI